MVVHCSYIIHVLWYTSILYMQVYFYDGSITCFQSSHLGVSIFALVGVVLVFLFPVLILVISFRTYKVSQVCHI